MDYWQHLLSFSGWKNCDSFYHQWHLTFYELWSSLVVQTVKNLSATREDVGSIPGLGRSAGGGNGSSLQYSCLENPWTEEPGGLQFMGSSRVRIRCSSLYPMPKLPKWWKNLPANAFATGDSGLIPGWGRSPGGGNGNPLQYSCLENPMFRGDTWATVHGVAKSRTRLNTQAWGRRWRWSFRPDDSTVTSGIVPAHRWELGGAGKNSDVSMRMRQPRGPWMDTLCSGRGKQKEETGQAHTVSPRPHHSWAKSSSDSKDKRWSHLERERLVERRAGRRVRGYMPRVPAPRMELRDQESKEISLLETRKESSKCSIQQALLWS